MKFEIGDIVKVVSYTPARYPPDTKDELGTERLFQSMVGNRYRVFGVDQYGNLELRPTRRDTIWISPKDVQLLKKRA